MRSQYSWLKEQIHRAALVPYRAPKSGAEVHPVWHLEKLGSDGGGWIVPTNLLSPMSICYCIGVGDDITFDLTLIERFGCSVFAYDPTPKAMAHVQRAAAGEHSYHFDPVGVWDRNEQVRFSAPADPATVPHSALDLPRTSTFFEAECRTLLTLLKENGHTRVDLLKLDIDGAEYRVLASLAADHVRPDVLCIEFDELHHALDNGSVDRIRQALHDLHDLDYELVAVQGNGYTFLRKWRVSSGNVMMHRAAEALSMVRGGGVGANVA